MRGRVLVAALVAVLLFAAPAYAWFFGPSGFNSKFFSSGKPSPATIANLYTWLSPQSGYTVDTTLDTNTVSGWNDAGTNDFTVVQETKTNQPVLTENTINGYTCPVFTAASSHRMLFPAGALGMINNKTGITVIAVVDPTTTGGTQTLLQASANAAASTTRFKASLGASSIGIASRRLDADSLVSQFSGSSAWVSGDAQIMSWKLQWTDSSQNLQVNGTTKTSTDPTWAGGDGNSQNTNSNLIGLGHSNSTEYWSGAVCEVVIYDRAITADELATVKTYLAAKYNITVN